MTDLKSRRIARKGNIYRIQKHYRLKSSCAEDLQKCVDHLEKRIVQERIEDFSRENWKEW